MAIDAFLDLVGPGGEAVPGESTDASFTGKIALRSIVLSSTGEGKEKKDKDGDADEDKQDAPPPSTGPKKRRFALSLTVTKDVDIASPLLFQEYSRKAEVKEAKRFEKAVVSLRKSQGKTEFVFLVLTFTNLFVSKYSVEAGDDGKLPLETVCCSFDGLTLEYAPQKTAAGREGKKKKKKKKEKKKKKKKKK